MKVRRRLLIIANTYYQLILAVQMRLTIFCKYDVILLLSDHSANSETVLNRLNQRKVFSEAYYIKTKGLVANRNGVQKVRDFFDAVLGRENRYSYYIEGIENRRFYEIICFNYNIDIIGIYSLLYRYNNRVKVSLFEEGILSYGAAIISIGKQSDFSEKHWGKKIYQTHTRISTVFIHSFTMFRSTLLAYQQ